MAGESHQNSDDLILHHLQRHGVVDKDLSRGPDRATSRLDSQRRRSGYRATVDLHGMTETLAEQTLRNTFQRCLASGIGEILIIHGQGLHSDPKSGPVLKSLVTTMLENELEHHVRSFFSAPPREGGAGATIVRLRFRKIGPR